MKIHSNRQTAYEFNSHSSELIPSVKDHGWASPINRMIDQRYAFLNLTYDNKGFLFRGMNAGVFNAILNKQFWYNAKDENDNDLEQELGVIFVSQDLSDALTASRLWEDKSDACILVIRASLFHQELLKKQVAMMATAEPGVVFKYPLFTSPLLLADVDYLILHPGYQKHLEKYCFDKTEYKKLSDELDRLHSINKILIAEEDPNINNNDRTRFETGINKLFDSYNILSAKVIECDIKPVRQN